MTFRPMLSATIRPQDIEKLRFPLFLSPKLDGIRAMVLGGQLVSRNLKPIPNKFTREMFSVPALQGLDGELILGDPWDHGVCAATDSAVMTHEGSPGVFFHVFDKVDMDQSATFEDRLSAVVEQVKKSRMRNVVVVPQVRIAKPLLLTMESTILEQGFEGVVLRDPDGLRKNGRSTLREHGLMKLKRFKDAEAEIVSFEEELHNANEAKINALGAMERGHKKAGKMGKGTLGALVVVGLNGQFRGVTFKVGAGFTAEQRHSIWKLRNDYIGKVVKYKYFEPGSLDAPRHPVFLMVRSKMDMK